MCRTGSRDLEADSGLGFRIKWIYGSGFRVWGSGFGIRGYGLGLVMRLGTLPDKGQKFQIP